MSSFVAVIPARAGSKGVPNKNIRLINGKPLVAYAINNALKSRYIHRVIVTSDSDHILAIAKNMGVEGHKRDSSLCGDAVTLDSVVFDAVKNDKSDYVITMQPTSPTLNYESLDRAIDYLLEHDYDTVISCKNDPRLSWELDNCGLPVPKYKARVNRQYMEPEYVETGAFFITKRKFVNCDSRLGKRVSVFPISDKEAIDIDTFDDFIVAQRVLERKKIAFYTNGSCVMGTGHIRRTLTLADEFDSKPDIYFDATRTDSSIFGNTAQNIYPLGCEQDLIRVIEEKQYDILINDTLETNEEIMAYLQSIQNLKIVNIDDVGNGAEFADLVINPFYKGEDSKKKKYGERYFVINNIFRLLKPIHINEHVKRVFVSFGGADPANYSQKLVSILSKGKYRDLEITVVLGNAYINSELLRDMCDKVINITLLQNVSNIYEYMLASDIAISARGITSYELASLGIPTIVAAENELEESHTFLSDENGFTYLGLYPNEEQFEKAVDNLIAASREERQKQQDRLLACDIKNGILRVKKLIDTVGGNND